MGQNISEIRETRRITWRKVFIDHNPFYLLSALCMIGGYYILTGTLAPKAGMLKGLLILLTVLNVYEGLLISLGLYLYVKGKLKWDGTILLLLEMLFLSDATFLNVEIFTANPVYGVYIHIAIAFLAAIKIGTIIYVLKPNYSKSFLICISTLLAVLFAVPGMYAFMGRNRLLTIPVVYSVWWGAGIMLGLIGVFQYMQDRNKDENRVNPLFHYALTAVPYILLIVHLSALSWIHSIPFTPATIAPIILGFCIYSSLVFKRFVDEEYLIWAHLLIPLVAIGFSMVYPAELEYAIGKGTMIMFSPFRMGFVGTCIVYGIGYYIYRYTVFAIACGISGMMSMTGYSIRSVYERTKKIIPDTDQEWGIVAVIGAFLLLGVGAWISFTKMIHKKSTALEPRGKNKRKHIDPGKIIMMSIEIFAGVLLIALVSLVSAREGKHNGFSGNAGAAGAGLRTYGGMMQAFRRGRYTSLGESFPVGNDPEVPNSGKLCGLYYEVNNRSERITLIGAADAHADCRADGNTEAKESDGSYIPSIQKKDGTEYLEPVTWESCGKAGYWFGLMKYYYDGTNTIPYDREFSKNHYAIVAFPDDYGFSGQATFIVNEQGILYAKDLGKGEYIDTFPGPDPVVYGWEKLQ